MNEEELIRAALERRFARTVVPTCPEGAWHPAVTARAANGRSTGTPRRFLYAAAVLVAVAVAGLTAQAAPVIQQTYANLVRPLFVSSKPLQPLIHASDRLSIAQAQQQIPFTIVEPTGLPAGTQFLYATHRVGKYPAPRVVLTYQAHVASKYYRIAISESTVAIGPPVAHFEVRTPSGIKKWTLPLRRWKHGALVMDMPAWALPPAMADRIVRANTQ